MSELEDLHGQIATCPACDLCKSRTHAVPGEGAANAEVMLVGEGPGFHEDQQARPFVGPAGHFLDELLSSVGLRRSEVYITNVVKCRPPQNRDPLPAEIEACRRHLERQIDLIKPRLIVTLGRYSLAWFFPKDSISKVHGHLRQRDGRYFVHMYHPAAALHAGNLRSVIMEDFLKVPVALAQAREASQTAAAATAAVEPAAEQMRLF
ncbi:MAG: uracil-DNA glycosylase [Dehalococcoidia bacterium]|nr:uracil-DNA glycosylase [Dehalococcoidia bacterium]